MTILNHEDGFYIYTENFLIGPYATRFEALLAAIAMDEVETEVEEAA